MKRLPLLTLGLAACWNIQYMSPNQPCKEVGYAISSRIYECTGDPDAANQAYEDFFAEYQCIPIDTQTQEVDRYFHCGVSIGWLACEGVEEFGDDWSQWLSVSPSCPYVVEPIDGKEETGP